VAQLRPDLQQARSQRWTHNPKVAGSTPAPGTIKNRIKTPQAKPKGFYDIYIQKDGPASVYNSM